MSDDYYDKFWYSIHQNEEELLALDQNLQQDQTPKSKYEALRVIVPIYLKYRNLVQKLAELYDRMVQYQKRELIKRLFDCCVGRMLEYRKEIVKLNCSEYEWPDDHLINLKWTPDDIEIPSISSYTSDRREELQKRREYIDTVNERAKTRIRITEPEEMTDKTPLESTPSLTRAPSMVRRRKSMKSVITAQLPIPIESESARIAREAEERHKQDFANAILLIQNFERARVGRMIGIETEKALMYRKKLERGEIEVKKYKRETRNRAAVTIQKLWRGYWTRKMLAKRREETEMALRMIVPSRKNDVSRTIFETDRQNRIIRHERQEQSRTEVEETYDQQRAKISEREGHDMMDDIAEEIRAWFQEWLSAVGHFDVYPSAQNGGSVLIATGQTLTPEEFLIKKMEEKMAAEGKKKKEEKKEEKKGKREDKKSAKDKEEEGWIMPASKVLKTITEVRDEFVKDWSLMSEDNLKKKVITGVIKDEIYYELQLKMRNIIDDMMRLELDRMNDALTKDHKDDEVKFEFPGMKKGKKKKEKKGGKKKKKKGEVQVNREEIQEMFQELVASGIIKNYPEAKLDDWFGDLSFANFETKKELKDHGPRLGEMKRAIMDICILPIGSKGAHMASPLVRSVCITGLPRMGKSLLATAIANEIGALLFDLTPSVIAGQYEGKENEKKLMKMINTLARDCPPSIVLVDGGDKPWWKKIPPEEKETQPKRLAKLLPKFVKGIKPGDQILVLGLASEPWKASKKFFKIYEKFIMIPPSDYNSVYLFYQDLLMKYHNVERHFNISAVAQVSVGYPMDAIREAVENVLNLRRRMRLKFDPLRTEEIITELQKYPRVPPKVIDQYTKFQMKTPLGRKWVKMMKKEREEVAEIAQQKRK